MGEFTEIGWCDHTFNGWIGCAKISRGCRFCYAELLENRWHPDPLRRTATVWGRNAPRRRTSAAYWRQPYAWNRKAANTGVLARTFGFSLGDVFEEHDALPGWRDDLFTVIEETPFLRWMLLTKRIDLVAEMTAARWGTDWPANVWLGTSVEGQAEADTRLPTLLNLAGPAERFVSAEPLLEPTSTARHLTAGKYPLSLMIGGGESGAKARGAGVLLEAARQLRTETAAADVPFMWKQWGEFVPCSQASPESLAFIGVHDRAHGGNPDHPHRVKKHRAGRHLDGQMHDGVVRSWAAETAWPVPA